ncbi:threonine/serine exporter family protein [Enterococcus faecalis]
MLENGSEVYRVEDTIERIAENAGQTDCVSYITATGLFVGFRSSSHTQLENISQRAINLEKVSAVNDLSRKFAAKELTIHELNRQLHRVDTDIPEFPLSWQILAAGIVSCTLMYIFGGTWQDFPATFVIGMVGFGLLLSVQNILKIPFLGDFLAAFAIGFFAYLAVSWHFAANLDNIIIGAVMPLVPGVAITNAFRDILAGHLISGTARITEAIFVASSIGIGIAVVFKLFM